MSAPTPTGSHLSGHRILPEVDRNKQIFSVPDLVWATLADLNAAGVTHGRQACSDLLPVEKEVKSGEWLSLDFEILSPHSLALAQAHDWRPVVQVYRTDQMSLPLEAGIHLPDVLVVRNC